MTAPVYFLSHGTAFLLQNDSRVRDYWRKIGQEALDNGCKGVIMMAAHWNVNGDNQIRVAMKPEPGMMPLTNAHPDIWKNSKPNTDIQIGKRADETIDWMIDSEIALVGMFGDKCPPTVIISQNSYWDPWFHARMGAAVRSLRHEGYLLISSGGGTHNLYRTEWHYALKYRDVFANMEDFYHSVRDDPDHSVLAPAIWSRCTPHLPESTETSKLIPVPRPNPLPSVSISSMGLIDKIITPRCGLVEVKNPWVTGEELSNGLGVFLGTFRGRLCLSATYDDAWHDKAEVLDFLDRCIAIVVQSVPT